MVTETAEELVVAEEQHALTVVLGVDDCLLEPLTLPIPKADIYPASIEAEHSPVLIGELKETGRLAIVGALSAEALIG